MPPIKPATLVIRVQCEGNVTEEALEQIETALQTHPEAVDLRFARAVLLEELGRLTLARGAYKGVLAREATHFGALMNLGTMLYLEGRKPEARILYQQATKAHPDQSSAFVNLGNVLAEDDPVAARDAYLRGLQIEPGHATGNFGLALLLEAHGDVEGARAYRQRAFAEPIVRVTPYRGAGEPVRVLMLLAANGGNVLTTLLLDDTLVETTSLVADSYRDGMTLPPHDLIFNAIGDADRADDTLEIAARIAAASDAPLLNPPAAVLRTHRTDVQRLRDVPGVTAPHTELFTREDVTPETLAARGFTFPLLMRAPGYHMGEHFAFVKTAADLPEQLRALPGAEILAIAFMDARGKDGKPRKYRALIVNGELYPVHLAISNSWKIHYFSADMRDNAEHQAEEKLYLDDIAGALGDRAMNALRGIVSVLGLDYGGIDFGIGADGSVLVFEANAAMGIYWPDSDPRFAYRHAAIERIVTAARAMFVTRARR